MVSNCSEKPIRAPPRLSEVSLLLPLGKVPTNVRLFDDGPSLVISRKIVDCFLFQPFSPPGDRCCNTLGFVPAGSVSSSSTLQIFRDTKTTCNGCFARQPANLFGHFPPLRRVQGSTVLIICRVVGSVVCSSDLTEE